MKLVKYIALLIMISCTTTKKPVVDNTPPNTINLDKPTDIPQSCLVSVPNHSIKESFVKDLASWSRSAPASLFEANSSNSDVYSLIAPSVGPLVNIKQRRAAMIQTLTLMAAYESDFNYSEGYDRSKDIPNTCFNEEAGVFQTSYDSVALDKSLHNLIKTKCGSDDCKTFISCSKQSDHDFVFTYTASLLRITTRHWGTLNRHQMVVDHLSRQCVLDMERIL